MGRPMKGPPPEPDPDRPGMWFRPCDTCGRKIHGTIGNRVPNRCGTCRRSQAAVYNTKTDRERTPLELLGGTVTAQRLAINDAILALEKGRPAVALAVLQGA